MRKIGEYEYVLNKLLCKNERLKDAQAVYKRIGVSDNSFANGSMDINQPSENIKFKLDAIVLEKKLCCGSKGYS